ncbi:MAG TPA: RluA family pseudouridine synthase [Thermoanaerobaculia bacterium]|jgi:23S rRNA-/tRNA-specific pseudouridylate synthase|nr:RluA family pseudouridine synthase [Thermoanaerobaculia bacterium]
MRLDQAIAARFPNISRRKARALLASGSVLVNQRRVSIASRDVSDADEIAIVETRLHVPLLAIKDDWLAVDKPAGLPTQPPRDRQQLSLEELLRVEYKRIWLVHRLDTPASGVVLFARSADAAARLSRLFASREVRKIYLARVDPPIASEIVIDTPIDEKDATTVVRPRERDLVEVEIETGRTHQIRRHLSSIGHPVVGDRRYGSMSNASRLMLHAWKIEHADIGTIEAPVPADFL